MHSGKMLAAARVAATYAGTVIGAGFASGQEIMQFFVVYGSGGLAGILTAGVLLSWLGVKIIDLGYSLHANTYHQIFYHICGRRIGILLDIFTVFFLFGGLSIMISGTGTVCRDYFGLSFHLGLALMAIAMLLTTCGGLNRIAAANTLVIPLLTLCTISISIQSLIYHDIKLTTLTIPFKEISAPAPAPGWLVSSLLYTAYNLVLATTVLAPLGRQTAARSVRLWGGLGGGLLLMCMATFMMIVIILHFPAIQNYEVPMLYIAGQQSVWNHSLYGLALLMAMYTTAIALLYGCTTKMQALTNLPEHMCIMLMTAAGLACSYIGFTKLINLLYPLFGYMTIWFTVRLIWRSIRGK